MFTQFNLTDVVSLRLVLMGCVLGYFFLMGVLTVYTTYKEKGIFVAAYQKDPAGVDPTNHWEASSSLKKYDDLYELILEYKDGKTKKVRKASSKRSVAQFFDDNGVLLMDQVEHEVTKLHNNLLSSRKSK